MSNVPFKPSRRALFVLNNYTEDEYRLLCTPSFTSSNGLRFICFGKEICPTTQTPHLQGYIEFTGPKSAKQIHTFPGLVRASFVRAGGDSTVNIKYCQKDGLFQRFGSPAITTQGKRVDLKKLKDEIMKGTKTVNKVLLDDPKTYHQYGRTLLAIETLRFSENKRSTMTQGFWLIGKTSTGKSHYIHSMFPGLTYYNWIVSSKIEWQDGYKQQDVVFIDDFRGQIPYEDLLKMIDKWYFPVNRRNTSSIPFTSKYVVITSPLLPHECYPRRHAKDNIEQLLRRVRVITLTTRIVSDDSEDASTTASEIVSRLGGELLDSYMGTNYLPRKVSNVDEEGFPLLDEEWSIVIPPRYRLTYTSPPSPFTLEGEREGEI